MRMTARATIRLASALWMLGVAGCSSSTPSHESAGLEGTELHFNLDQCQPQGGGLFKCPAIDKPICNPDYVGTDVQCVRIGKSGKVIIQQLQY
jgi:hypothetical protein